MHGTSWAGYCLTPALGTIPWVHCPVTGHPAAVQMWVSMCSPGALHGTLPHYVQRATFLNIPVSGLHKSHSQYKLFHLIHTTPWSVTSHFRKANSRDWAKFQRQQCHDSNSDEPDTDNPVPCNIHYMSRYSWVVHERFSGQPVEEMVHLIAPTLQFYHLLSWSSEKACSQESTCAEYLLIFKVKSFGKQLGVVVKISGSSPC